MNYKSNLMADIYQFASSVILEINKKFPHQSLLSAMKILNPQEWPKDKEDLMDFGDVELKELISIYRESYLLLYPLGIIDPIAI